MEQTRLAIYQLSSLSPDAELLLSSAINKVFGEDVIAAERPAVLKDIHEKNPKFILKYEKNVVYLQLKIRDSIYSLTIKIF